MKKYVGCLILLVAILSSNNAYSCQDLEDQKATLIKNRDDAITNRATEWGKYRHNCFVNNGPHNICVYADGISSRELNSANTRPPENCDSIACMTLAKCIFLLSPITCSSVTAVTTQLKINNLNFAVDSDATDGCKLSCKAWYANDKTISDFDSLMVGLDNQKSIICADPCKGLLGVDYEKCQCDNKDKKVWTWDISKNPAECVACKGRQGDEYNKCLCENVQQGLWNAKDKGCYGLACSGLSGIPLDKCICETEKKLKWDANKKVCNYTPDPKGPTLNPTGDGPATTGDAGPGYTAAGAAAGLSGSSVSSSVGDFAGGGLLDNDQSSKTGDPTKKLKQSSGSWYQNLLGAMGLEGLGRGGSAGGSGGSAQGDKVVKPYEEKKVASAPTDISSKKSDDIFAQVTKVYTVRYRSEILRFDK